MTEVNRLPTGFPTCSAGRGPIAVRADVGFPSLFGLPGADQSIVRTLPQWLDRQSGASDGHSPSA